MSERFLVTAAEVVTVRQKYDKVQKLYRTFKDLQTTIDRSGPTESAALAKVLKDVQTQLVKLANEVKVGIEKVKKSDVNPPFREFANRVAARAKEHYNVKAAVKTAVDVKEGNPQHYSGGIIIGYSAAVVLSSKDKAGTILINEISALGGTDVNLWMKAQAGTAEPKPAFETPDRYFSSLGIKDDQIDVFVHQAAGLAGIPAKGQKAGSGTGTYGELLKVFPNAKKTAEGFEFKLSGEKELDRRKEPLNLPSSAYLRLEQEVAGLGKLSAELGCSTKGSLSFEELDYYDGTDSEDIPVFTLIDNKFSAGSNSTNTIPKGWAMQWNFTVKVPANAKLTEKDFLRFDGKLMLRALVSFI